MAKIRNINFLFEASVGGGIPIIRPINSSMTAEKIEEITGILNGTTNYMLSKMYFEGADYDEVLKDAQARGYAERHPEADVEGLDACRKIAILSSLIAGQQVDYEDIYTEGITNITSTDITYAKKLGMEGVSKAGAFSFNYEISNAEATKSKALLKMGETLGLTVNQIMPEDRPGAFNQALMELGELICLPNGAAKCGECPLAGICFAEREGLVKELPFRSKAKERAVEDRTILILASENRVFIRTRENKGLLAGLCELPSVKGRLSASDARRAAADMGLCPAEIEALPEAKHDADDSKTR